MGADNPEIEVGSLDGGLYISVKGRATQRTCPTAEKLVADFLAAHEAREAGAAPGLPIIVDVRGSEWMDSTFAGWLVGLQKRVLRMPGTTLRLANCRERCHASLRKMQLGDMFTFVDAEPPADLKTVPCAGSDRPSRETIELMIEAHEALAALGPENARVFAPIVQVLRQQLARQ